ncbi:hypothetical protein NC652_019440 [Populus alba x Populus x berolinensis]|nr:hypothetical protein NC652_019440 [Populus alba x Populus x berolinensis]
MEHSRIHPTTSYGCVVFKVNLETLLRPSDITKEIAITSGCWVCELALIEEGVQWGDIKGNKGTGLIVSLLHCFNGLGSCLQKTAKSGLHILLGGVCALTVVVFFRFIVLTRIKYGPARYWAILFVFWFLVFGIWASRTHDAHTT